MFALYKSALAKRPLLTQSIGSAILFGAGDVLAQQVVDRKGLRNHDLTRTGRMCLYGGVIFGPAATTWYRILERNVRVASSSRLTIASRVLADQAFFAPIHMCVFLSSMSIMEGTDPVEKVRDNFKRGYIANLMLWPAVQSVNFTFVPLDHRVLFTNVVALGWNCVLSVINQGSREKEE